MSALRPIDRSLPAQTFVEAGPAPMLQWIDIDLLDVDERYQREFGRANVAAALKIAGQFDWSKFSTVHVAPIEGGRFAIIDGQHRVHAAAACGFSSVPCQITPMTLEGQAAAFAAINGFATPVTVWQLFRAALAAGHAWAVEVRDVCHAADCKAMVANTSARAKKAGEIYAVTYLRQLIKAHGASKVSTVLTIIRQGGKIGDDPATYAAGFLKPLVASLLARADILDQPTEASRALATMSLWRLQEAADRLNAGRRKSGLQPLQRVDALEGQIVEALDRAIPKTPVPAPSRVSA